MKKNRIKSVMKKVCVSQKSAPPNYRNIFQSWQADMIFRKELNLTFFFVNSE